MNIVSLKLTLDNASDIAEKFLSVVGDYRKFSFSGSMGAGKTTFITSICQKLKAIDSVSSPTFSIVNEYETETEELIYHFDFYRIENPEELYDIGFEEYCVDNHWCFIEWPEKAQELIPEDFISVAMIVEEDDNREIQIKFPA